MMFEEHCKHCEEVLGERFEHVHLWLDELFKYFGPGHRAFRHNSDGVMHVRETWGDRAAEAAILHLKDDGEYTRKLGELYIPDPLFGDEPVKADKSKLFPKIMICPRCERAKFKVEECPRADEEHHICQTPLCGCCYECDTKAGEEGPQE